MYVTDKSNKLLIESRLCINSVPVRYPARVNEAELFNKHTDSVVLQKQ